VNDGSRQLDGLRRAARGLRHHAATLSEELEARLWEAVRAGREVHERIEAVREAALGAEQVDVEKLRAQALR
jgi:hypothetical protein